jgi:hypothetical protein
MDLREIAWKVVDYILLDRSRNYWPALMNTIMKLRVP